MGGNAFQNTKRLSDTEYCAKVEEILSALQANGIRAAVPPALLDKVSHGDIDVLVVTNNMNTTTETLQKAIGASEIKVGGNKMGQLLTPDRVQVDLIAVTDSSFDLTLATKSHGRFIHLLNMVLRKQALALTDKGLEIVFTKERKHVLCTDLRQVAGFFGFPVTIFDGKTRFTSNEVLDALFRCQFFDVRQFAQLETRDDLLGSTIFATLLDRIRELTDDQYNAIGRCVAGENKAGRIAAKFFGIDFDELKNGQASKVEMKRKLHGGFFVSLVPDLRKHKEVIKRMPQLLLDLVAEGDWSKLKQWIDETSQEEKKAVLEEVVAREVS